MDNQALSFDIPTGPPAGVAPHAPVPSGPAKSTWGITHDAAPAAANARPAAPLRPRPAGSPQSDTALKVALGALVLLIFLVVVVIVIGIVTQTGGEDSLDEATEQVD
jgi:hypothetical protein